MENISAEVYEAIWNINDYLFFLKQQSKSNELFGNAWLVDDGIKIVVGRRIHGRAVLKEHIVSVFELHLVYEIVDSLIEEIQYPKIKIVQYFNNIFDFMSINELNIFCGCKQIAFSISETNKDISPSIRNNDFVVLRRQPRVIVENVEYMELSAICSHCGTKHVTYMTWRLSSIDNWYERWYNTARINDNSQVFWEVQKYLGVI